MYEQIKMRKLQDAFVSEEVLKAISEKLNHWRLSNCQLRVYGRFLGTHYSKHIKKVWDKCDTHKIQGRSREFHCFEVYR